MARPKTEHPTPAELEVLKILWEQGPLPVRGVMEELQSRRRRRAYTTVMSLLNVMTEKGLLRRRRQGRAFVYEARRERESTLSQLAGDLWRRAFEGSASTLVSHVLEAAHPTPDELDAIRKTIEAYEHGQRKEDENA